MSYQPNKPLLSDEEIREIRSHHDHALSVKQSAYQVRDIYESHRAMDGRLIQVLVDACAELNEGWEQMIAGYGYDPGDEPKDAKNQIARSALQLAAENGYTPSDE